jgi:predicted RNA polymerase sigma factor
MPSDGEVAGLLALMLLTEARRPARLGADGELVPLESQNRLSWDGALIEEGVALISAVLPVAPLGPYQLQAAIAAVHAEAPSAKETDWTQIVGLYTLLERFEPGPMVTLNRAVAVAQVQGPVAGLSVLSSVESSLGRHHRWHAVRAHLLELAGDVAGAREAYQEAARRTASLPERRYLTTRAARLP